MKLKDAMNTFFPQVVEKCLGDHVPQQAGFVEAEGDGRTLQDRDLLP